MRSRGGRARRPIRPGHVRLGRAQLQRSCPMRGSSSRRPTPRGRVVSRWVGLSISYHSMTPQASTGRGVNGDPVAAISFKGRPTGDRRRRFYSWMQSGPDRDRVRMRSVRVFSNLPVKRSVSRFRRKVRPAPRGGRQTLLWDTDLANAFRWRDDGANPSASTRATLPHRCSFLAMGIA